jgi:anti-sigma factor RsiW
MADVPMTRARFEAILDAYGADPRRWPDAERAAAQAFAAADPQAPALLAAAADLDGALHLAAPDPAEPALREAIIASAKAAPARRRSLWWAGAGLSAALAGAAAGAVTVGVMAPGAGGELAAEQIAGASTAFDDLDEGAVR